MLIGTCARRGNCSRRFVRISACYHEICHISLLYVERYCRLLFLSHWKPKFWNHLQITTAFPASWWASDGQKRQRWLLFNKTNNIISMPNFSSYPESGWAVQPEKKRPKRPTTGAQQQSLAKLYSQRKSLTRKMLEMTVTMGECDHLGCAGSGTYLKGSHAAVLSPQK